MIRGRSFGTLPWIDQPAGRLIKAKADRPMTKENQSQNSQNSISLFRRAGEKGKGNGTINNQQSTNNKTKTKTKKYKKTNENTKIFLHFFAHLGVSKTPRNLQNITKGWKMIGSKSAIRKARFAAVSCQGPPLGKKKGCGSTII